MRTGVLLILALVLLIPSQSWARPSTLQKQAVDTSRVGIENQLINEANLIVYGRYDTASQIIPTSRRANGGKLVNYIQHFQVRHAFKGTPPPIIRIIATGIDPLPPAGDPSHMTYPGPVAEGIYVIFLKKIDGHDLYRLIGGWQGLYPVEDGKLISLKDAGFPSLSDMPLGQLKPYLDGKR